MTLSLTPFSIMTLSAAIKSMTLSITTFSIKVVRILKLDIWCCYAECRVFVIVMLIVAEC